LCGFFNNGFKAFGLKPCKTFGLGPTTFSLMFKTFGLKLKTFGLMPRTFHLRDFARTLIIMHIINWLTFV
jgi:hypothetical protein